MATYIRGTGTNLQVAVEDWLFNSNVRIRSGRHTGAIAGWLDERGNAGFAYPEATGYYLSWLKQVAQFRPELDTRSAAEAAVAWLDLITNRNGPPATRYYPDCREDWHNDGTFTFDLAMLCRGLHAVRPLIAEQPLTSILTNLLRKIVSGCDVIPVAIDVRRELPDRWSTRAGPFQLKTAAALLSVQPHPASWNTFYRWRGRVLDQIDPGELHAAFYALEGLVQFGLTGEPGALQEAEACFESIFSYIRDERSDVIAQAMRLGCGLRSLGFLKSPRWVDRLAELRSRLEAFMLDSGGVSFFASGNHVIHVNTWAAIFAWQALKMSEPGVNRKPDLI